MYQHNKKNVPLVPPGQKANRQVDLTPHTCVKSSSALLDSSPHACASSIQSRKSVPKGDIDSQWSHDLFEGGNSLSSRLSTQPIGAPRMNISNIAQKAIREATNGHVEPLSIKGAGSATQANVVEVSGLVAGTTAEDVAAIFKQCGTIMSSDTVSRSPQDPKIRITFKIPASATTAVQKFNGQTADGKVLSVRIIGISGTSTSLVGRLGGLDGLDLVREEQSVDILLTSGDMPTS